MGKRIYLLAKSGKKARKQYIKNIIIVISVLFVGMELLIIVIDHSGYCSNCQARKRCLLGDELKKYTFSEQSEHTFTAQEVYNIQYEKKEIWKKSMTFMKTFL